MNNISNSWLRRLQLDYGDILDVEVLSVYGLFEGELVSINRYTSFDGMGVAVGRHIIFRDIVRNNIDTVVILHNHPDGTLAESESDIRITKQVEDFCSYLGVNFLGHYIVASRQLYRVDGEGSELGEDFRYGVEREPRGPMYYTMRNVSSLVGSLVTEESDIEGLQVDDGVMYLGVNKNSIITVVTRNIEDLIGVGSPYYIKVTKNGCQRVEDDLLLKNIGMLKVLNIVK